MTMGYSDGDRDFFGCFQDKAAKEMCMTMNRAKIIF